MKGKNLGRWIGHRPINPNSKESSAMRYQVDCKVYGGDQLLGLRTLELSQVQSANAEVYRPRDGGENMRQ